MKKHLLKGILTGVSMLLGAAAASAAIPEHLYLVGPSSPGLWNLECVPEMVNEGDGVFSYRGNLFKGELQFINDNTSWETAVRYVPEVNGWWLTNASTATIKGEINNENKWYVNDFGTWEVTAYFADEGNSVMFTAERVGDLSPMMVPLGASPNQWDSAFPYPASYIYPEEGTTDVFVYEGTMPANNFNQLKFIAYPTNWWEAEFYLPADLDADQVYKTVELGKTYSMRKSQNGDPANTGKFSLDNFWRLPLENCLPFKTYKATVNLTDMTIVFTGGEQTYVPEHLYMVGTASPSLWNTDMLEMTSEGNGVFSYHGNLYQGEMRFLDIPDFGNAISYVPYNGGSHIIDTSAQIVQIKGEPGRNWWVPDYGEWNIKVTITDGGKNVSVSAERLGDMTPQVYALGHATGAWDCLWPTYSSYILPKEESPNVFVWEGSLNPDLGGDGADLCRHFKFIAYPKAWDQGCIFYVPESVDHNGNVKKVEIGGTYPVSQNTVGNGELDWFWGFPQDKCTPDNVYKATLDLNNKTISFADARGITDSVAKVATCELKAGFIGDNLVVEGASSAIAVYDIAGRLVASSADGSLTVVGLPHGVYVVKTAETAVKVAK